VVVLEQTNIRDLLALPTKDEGRRTDDDSSTQHTASESHTSRIAYQDYPAQADLATADVSFIGLELITLAALRLTGPDAFYIFLIKPQFEAGRDKVGKGGVVRDPRVHRDVIIRLAEHWQSMGLRFEGLARSPITGPAGNVEYLAYLEKQGPPAVDQFAIRNLQSAIDREVFGHDK
jgi:predicted rRNA methylase YqxC with S4 and FtsJ domains